MRQNIEELTATQEEVASVEFELNGKILSGDSIFLGISGYKLETLMQYNYPRLLPGNERDNGRKICCA